MSICFFKRYRMQCDLEEHFPNEIPALNGYQFHPWRRDLLNAHAEAKFRSFRNELDCNVFSSLGDADGCLRLMREIASRRSFVPEATWLLTRQDPLTQRVENVGTIQGIREQKDVGSIQNVGVASQHRGQRLGSALLRHSLAGFQSAGVRYVTLEVTGHNTGALKLYKAMGFRVLKIVFKSAEFAYPG